MYRDKISGATAEWPELKKLIEALTSGDVVIIPAVDRLSRDTTDFLVIPRDMQRAGAGLNSMSEPVVDTASDFAEQVLAMPGVAAKLERCRIIERSACGRADAKAKWVQFGRKRKLTQHQQREARKLGGLIRAQARHSDHTARGRVGGGLHSDATAHHTVSLRTADVARRSAAH